MFLLACYSRCKFNQNLLIACTFSGNHYQEETSQTRLRRFLLVTSVVSSFDLLTRSSSLSTQSKIRKSHQRQWLHLRQPFLKDHDSNEPDAHCFLIVTLFASSIEPCWFLVHSPAIIIKKTQARHAYYVSCLLIPSWAHLISWRAHLHRLRGQRFERVIKDSGCIYSQPFLEDHDSNKPDAFCFLLITLVASSIEPCWLLVHSPAIIIKKSQARHAYYVSCLLLLLQAHSISQRVHLQQPFKHIH